MPSETSYTTDGPSLSSMYRCPNLCVVNLQHYRQTQYTLTPQVRNEDVVQTVASHPSTHAKAHSAPNMALSVNSTCIQANNMQNRCRTTCSVRRRFACKGENTAHCCTAGVHDRTLVVVLPDWEQGPGQERLQKLGAPVDGIQGQVALHRV